MSLRDWSIFSSCVNINIPRYLVCSACNFFSLSFSGVKRQLRKITKPGIFLFKFFVSCDCLSVGSHFLGQAAPITWLLFSCHISKYPYSGSDWMNTPLPTQPCEFLMFGIKVKPSSLSVVWAMGHQLNSPLSRCKIANGCSFSP